MEVRIFIATQGISEVGEYLYDRLSKFGVKVCLDEGADRLSDKEMEKRISTCSHFVLILDSNLSERLSRLVNWAVEYRRKIIPVVTNKNFNFPASVKHLKTFPAIETDGNNSPLILKKLQSIISDTETSMSENPKTISSNPFEISTNPENPKYLENNIDIGLRIMEKNRWLLPLFFWGLLVLLILLMRQPIFIYNPQNGGTTMKTESVEPISEISKTTQKTSSRNVQSFISSARNNNFNVQQAIVSGNGNVVQQQMQTQGITVSGEGKFNGVSIRYQSQQIQGTNDVN